MKWFPPQNKLLTSLKAASFSGQMKRSEAKQRRIEPLEYQFPLKLLFPKSLKPLSGGRKLGFGSGFVFPSRVERVKNEVSTNERLSFPRRAQRKEGKSQIGDTNYVSLLLRKQFCLLSNEETFGPLSSSSSGWPRGVRAPASSS